MDTMSYLLGKNASSGGSSGETTDVYYINYTVTENSEYINKGNK